VRETFELGPLKSRAKVIRRSEIDQADGEVEHEKEGAQEKSAVGCLHAFGRRRPTVMEQYHYGKPSQQQVE
jgi:hypothetical protein